ncbi:hydroxyacid dehydrogenase [Verrucomicrobia bacterium LW23]|nr:hydroxyacid dehydrogenase [Verrucomicrobia bacterium LW23]
MFTDPAVLPCPAESPSAPLRRAPRRSGRVLFALSATEWKLFFPHVAGTGAAPRAHWCDQVNGSGSPGEVEMLRFAGDAGGAGLEEALRRLRPDVLVSSWTTPPLPGFVPEKMQDSVEYEASNVAPLPDAASMHHPFLDNEGRPMPRCVFHTTGSVRRLLNRAYLERGGIVTNWGDIAAQGVAEHALMLTLSSLRRQPDWAPVIAGHKHWAPAPVYTQTLIGKRVGLHGMGHVARALSQLLRPFGVKLQAWSAGVPSQVYADAQITEAPGLEHLFATSDVVIECEALTPRTLGQVSREVLLHMPPGALFVNVGRGLVVDEHALAELAALGRIRIALDVYRCDPIEPDSPLHGVESAILSPHIAGPTSDQFALCGELVMRNLEAWFTGAPLEAVLSLEMFDRST